MRVEIEPSRLQNMLNVGLIAGGKPLLDSVIAEFTPAGVVFRDSSIQETGVYAVYLKEYFNKYEVNKNEDVVISSHMREKSGWGYKKGEQVVLRTEDNHLIFEGVKNRYKERMPVLDKHEFAMEMNTKTPYGILPVKALPVKENIPVFVKIPSEILAALPPRVDKYKFVSDGSTLQVVVDDEIGEYSEEITPTEIINMQELEALYDVELFKVVAGNIDGELWWGITEEAMVFSQKTDNSAITFVLTGRLL